MKKLISLLILALISSQMWAGYRQTLNYSSNSNNKMGRLYAAIGDKSLPTVDKSDWKNASTYAEPSSTQKTTLGALAFMGYEFVGFSTSTSATTASQTDNPYKYSAGSKNNTYYAIFREISYSASQTKTYTLNSKACTMKAYDMKTGDGIYWGDRAIGTTDTDGPRGIGLYYRYGGLSNVTTADNSYNYSGPYTEGSGALANRLPAANDIATQTLGQGWRIPTQAEYTTLKSKVSIKKDYQSGDYAGAVATTAVNGKNNVIFFYYSGYYSTKKEYNSYSGNCKYWTSTKYDNTTSYMWSIAYTSSYSASTGWTSSTGASNTPSKFYAAQVKPVYDTKDDYVMTIVDADGSNTYKGQWGQKKTIKAADKDGYNFVQWSDGNTTQEREFYICNITYTAQYEPAATPRTVTISSTTNGRITVTDGTTTIASDGTNSAQFDQGKELTVTAIASDHYEFDSWNSGTPALTNSKFTLGSSDVTIGATFTAIPTYQVTINRPEAEEGTLVVTYIDKYDNNNSVTIAGNSISLEKYTSITVTATPATHYTGGAVITMGGNTVNTTTFTLSAAAAISTNFVEDAKYTVNITTPVNGTISVMNGSTPVSDGDKVYTGTTLTVTATADVANHYEFKSWKAGTPALDANNQFTLSSDVTIGANFGLIEYTIRFLMDDGETVINGYGGQVAHGAYPMAPADKDMTKMGDTYWTYEFAGWDANNDRVADGVSAATKNQDYVAVFTKISKGVIPPHNLTIGAATNGYVTLTPNTNSITVTVPAAGETYQYPEGTDIIVEAVPARGYHFTQWSDASTAKRRLISEIEDDWDLTATFAPNVAFSLVDTWDYDDCISNYNMDDVLTVTLTGRTFTAGQWATLSVPFEYTLTADDALYNAIYKFTNVTLSSDGGSVFLEFVRTNDIEKNEPYLVVPRQAGINEVVFDGVKLETPAAISLTTDDRVAFVSSLWQQEISGPNDFYIGKLSTLYYAPNSGMTIKGNRAFFHKITSSAPRRAIVVIDGEEVEVEIAGDAIEEVQDVRKYIENGILIIERNGVRMDAQGKRID